MAFMTLPAFSASGSLSSSPKTEGTICHDRPNLSFSQPHWLSSPPSVSFPHSSSTSACVSQFTKNEMASVKVNRGPPFSAMNSWPSSSKVAVMTDPCGPGPPSPYRETLVILEFLKMAV